MLSEVGFCKGIENYTSHLTNQRSGEPPACLLDYFPSDWLIFIDESHVTLPQIRGMYRGDRSRKSTLVEHGFRLPSALDNRPLKFDEFETKVHQVVYVSATPGSYELEKSEGVFVEQIIRPTGLLDPIVEVRPALHQVDDLLIEIRTVIQNQQKMVEEAVKDCHPPGGRLHCKAFCLPLALLDGFLAVLATLRGLLVSLVLFPQSISAKDSQLDGLGLHNPADVG